MVGILKVEKLSWLSERRHHRERVGDADSECGRRERELPLEAGRDKKMDTPLGLPEKNITC